MSMSKKKLWAAQMREWPGSVRLTPSDVFRWCDAAPNAGAKASRYAQVAMAIQYPTVVWYRIEDTEYRGFRFGYLGHQYMSMYSTT